MPESAKTTPPAPLPAEDVLRIAAAAADAKKGVDISAIKVRDLSSIADYFLFISATSTTQARAIYEGIDEALSKRGVEPLNVEGKNEMRWVLLDYADVIIHVFLNEAREFYGLERLWGDAPKVDLQDPAQG
ncbi:MAG: ribosome silencing factor [Leptospirillia bacterium]